MFDKVFEQLNVYYIHKRQCFIEQSLTVIARLRGLFIL